MWRRPALHGIRTLQDRKEPQRFPARVYRDTPRRRSTIINLQLFRADCPISGFLPLPVPPPLPPPSFLLHPGHIISMSTRGWTGRGSGRGGGETKHGFSKSSNSNNKSKHWLRKSSEFVFSVRNSNH